MAHRGGEKWPIEVGRSGPAWEEDPGQHSRFQCVPGPWTSLKTSMRTRTLGSTQDFNAYQDPGQRSKLQCVPGTWAALKTSMRTRTLGSAQDFNAYQDPGQRSKLQWYHVPKLPLRPLAWMVSVAVDKVFTR
ncbi:hypothetical protein PoB_004359700 [Plakobranchus ocellatus]|uniref:Uncharacterized protein n=1 Tax=Plakobranchus ocellatus TaxID=259542 RepID=A0AAV4BCC0_9GAST|nr:hypothetical protein PoB_004359700 [Plakobranchus ocellatus]